MTKKMRFWKTLKDHGLGIALEIVMLMVLLVGNCDAAPYAYITNENSNNVSVIDTATDKVVASINVGSHPYGVAVNPAGTRVYVTNQYSNTVSVINAETNTVMATISVGNKPQGIAVNPSGTKVYVANYGLNYVSVIDTATNTVTATILVGTGPKAVAVDQTRVYVANYNSETVSVINTATNTVMATIRLQGPPYGIAVNPAGTKVFVTRYSGSLYIIDTATNTATFINVVSTPYGVAMSPDGKKLYVTNYLSNRLTVVDAATNFITNVIYLGTDSQVVGVAVNPTGTKAYVAAQYSGYVLVVDTTTNTVVTKIKVGNGPLAVGKFIGPTPKSASVTITSPNGGENWPRGTSHDIRWTGQGIGPTVKIQLYKGGIPIDWDLVSSTPNDGLWSWPISSQRPTGTDYKVKIVACKGTPSGCNTPLTYAEDMSDNNFAISSAGITPSITVTSPNGGENWARGTTQTLKWTSSGSTGAGVKIELLKGTAVNRVILSSTPNDGSQTWTIPTTQTLGTDYKIRVTSLSYPTIKDVSNNNFVISNENSIRVISPNGGESWTRGSTKLITWARTGSTGANVRIQLYKGSTLSRTISSGTANDGSFGWTIPSTQAIGGDYKIKISSTTTSYNDWSNSNFRIY